MLFGIGVCRTDIVSGIGSHVEAAKRNIHFNNSTMIKRFEWIKRNRDNENLNSFNINLKSYNLVSNRLKLPRACKLKLIINEIKPIIKIG